MRPYMRFCIPEVVGKGAGLGNELFPWAKAYLASCELDATLLHPAWGRNPRRYRQYFGTSPYDWLWQRMLRSALPCYRFSREDYLATGEEEYGAAIRIFASRTGLDQRRSFVLLTQGMWGGFHAIVKARQFVVSALHGTRGTPPNLYDRQKRIDDNRLLVAVHIRLGDFLPPSELTDYVGVFNTAIPLEWYTRTCRSLRDYFGDRLMFLLLTDGDSEELRPFLAEFEPVTTFHQRMNVCSDLLAMAEADLLLCSVSSFSMWGAFLSSSPYIWYRPNLGSREGFLSIWGHEPDQQQADGITSRNIASARLWALSRYGTVEGRGVPVDRDGRLPPFLVQRLEWRLREKNLATDLLAYGVTSDDSHPVSAPAEPAADAVVAGRGRGGGVEGAEA